MKTKITLAIFIFILGINSIFSQFTSDRPDLRLCGSAPNYYTDYFNCTSNNYTLDNVFLSLTNINGVPLDNTTCVPGVSQSMYIMLNYTSNSNSNINHARLFADLIIDGVVTPLNVNFGTVVPGSGQRLLYGPFTWTCGQAMSLNRTLIVWKTNGNNTELVPYNCSSYSKSQCEFPGSVVIAAPLAVQFVYSGCTNGTSSTINFISTTNGGTPPYTYAWDFDNNGTTDSTLPNPTYTYNNTINYSAKLTVTDSMGLMNTYIVPIVYPTEINLNPVVQSLTCLPDSTASINLTTTGGTAPYTYLWSNGANNEDVSGLGIGNYSVVVTDALGCVKNYSTTISPIVCCEYIVTCPTFPPLTFQCYSQLPSDTVLTELEFEALGNGDGNIGNNPCGVIVITASNNPNPGCNTNATRIYTITEYADPNNNGIKDVGENTVLNTTTCNQNILVHDDIAPVIAALPATSTIDCPATPVFAVATATDNCGSAFTLTSADVTTNGDCAGSYSVTRTWTATDACGNTSTASQTINVQDISAPVIAALPATSTINCPATPVFAVASATDNCGSLFSLTYVDITTNGDCAGSYSVTRTWTATDDCGNASTASQTINVQDISAPIFTSELPNDISVSCDAVPSPGQVSASDNCDSDVDISVSDEIIRDEESCAGNYAIIRTWTIVDDCQNSNSYSQTITVFDIAPPTLVTPLDEELSVSCSSVPEIPNLQFEDNCSGVANVIFSEVVTTISVYEYVIIREWFVSDNCGNSDTFVQTINVTVDDPFDAIPYGICTQEEPIDLFSILDDSIPTNGVWVDGSETGGLNGSVFNPINIPVGYYTLQYIVTQENDNCPMVFEVYLNINNDCIVLAACDIIVYNAVSPNNDGINEFLFIDGIECYPNNTVQIYNKWGILIYDTQGYDNNTRAFRGQSEGRSTLNKNEGVPDGTYYYILKYTDAENKAHDKAGYLYVNK